MGCTSWTVSMKWVHRMTSVLKWYSTLKSAMLTTCLWELAVKSFDFGNKSGYDKVSNYVCYNTFHPPEKIYIYHVPENFLRRYFSAHLFDLPPLQCSSPCLQPLPSASALLFSHRHVSVWSFYWSAEVKIILIFSSYSQCRSKQLWFHKMSENFLECQIMIFGDIWYLGCFSDWSVSSSNHVDYFPTQLEIVYWLHH